MGKPDISEYEKNRTGGSGRGSGMVKPQDIALMQEKLFDILVYFDEFCEKYGVRYSLAGGTCIGAVRDHDFIAWDDDLDVAVLREDYDKLFNLWELHGDKDRFSLYRTTNEFCSYMPIGVMRNNSTTFIRENEKNLKDRVLGVKIDIEPMDEIPDDPKKRLIQKIYAAFYVLFLTQRIPRRKSVFITIGSTLLLGIFSGKKVRNKIVEICGKQVKKYNGLGYKKVAINGYGFVRYKTDIIEPTKMLFHGKYFNVPAEYDEFLKRGYGNWHRKPPVEKRIPGDTPFYYDLNMPYSQYVANN